MPKAAPDYTTQMIYRETRDDAKALAAAMSSVDGKRVSVPDALRLVVRGARRKWEKKAKVQRV